MPVRFIKVSGSVQGVGFRFSAKKVAISYGLKGFVKNNIDGSVEIVAVGNETAIKLFEAWCYKGPAMSRVNSVVSKSVELSEEFNTFDIKH